MKDSSSSDINNCLIAVFAVQFTEKYQGAKENKTFGCTFANRY